MARRILAGRAWWLFAELLLIMAAGAPNVCARTWVASADGQSGDGTVAEILPQIQEADSLSLLSGTHEWPTAVVRESLTLLGEDAATVTGYTVQFRETDFVSIINVTFSGLQGGMAFSDIGTVTVRECTYRDSGGPLLFIGRGGSLEVTDTLILDNRNEYLGIGGMHIGLGSVRIERCVFQGNWSDAGVRWDESEGGGGALGIGLTGSSAVVRNCVFQGNRAGSGSAMHCKSSGLVFEHNTVVGNSCEAGAIVVHSISPDPEATVIRQNVFAENAAFGLWIGDSGFGVPRVYCNAFWQNNTILLGDFDERDDHQWRAVAPHGYEGDNDFHSTLADPMFCDSLVVHKESELGDQEPPCGPIGGARGIGCVVDPTRSTSWGQLKDLLGK